MQLNILLVSRIDKDAIANLETSHKVTCAFGASESELLSLIGDTEILVFRSGVTISSQVLNDAPNLRLIVRAGSGLDNIDIESVQQHGVRMVRIPGPSAQAVAEFTLGLMLSVSRHVTLSDRLVRQGNWPKPDLSGNLLTGKILGIVGVGNIGTRVGELSVALGMKVIGYDVNVTQSRRQDLSIRGINLKDFDSVISQADFLTIHTSLNKSTHHLIDASVFHRMKPGAYLINTSRGGVVDEQALYEALVNGESLSGAALDVHEVEGEGTIPKLVALPNVVLTPHIAAMAKESQGEIGSRLLAMIEAFVDGSLDQKTEPSELVV